MMKPFNTKPLDNRIHKYAFVQHSTAGLMEATF